MATEDGEIELTLSGKRAELPGGLEVVRAIPQARRRMVGPFVFLDQMGPATVEAAREITVLPHPHIGLSTVTYLFEGEGLHRDSLGTVQPILPGEVNWMTAGRGIVHSERLRAGSSGRVYGVQIWVALPRELEECAPSFEHYDANAVPKLAAAGAQMSLVAGSLFGETSGVRTSSPLFYLDVRLSPGATLIVPPEYEERAAYVLEGALTIGQTRLQRGDIAFFTRGREVHCSSEGATHLLLLGGAPLESPRHIYWNFVSSSRERNGQAAEDWRHQRFARVPGETAYIPLPEDGMEPVNYP